MGLFDSKSHEARKERILKEREALVLDTKRKLDDLNRGLAIAMEKKDSNRISEIKAEITRVQLHQKEREATLNKAWNDYLADLNKARRST